MKGPRTNERVTWDEFLDLDLDLDLDGGSEGRYEFHDGELVAMAGATPTHALLAGRWVTRLSVALEGRPCEVYDSSLLVALLATRRGLHPDASVICGAPEYTEGDERGILNPSLIVEVLSPSTELFDRGEKFRLYQQIVSLHTYVLVSQRLACVEVFTRSGEGWLYRSYGPGEMVRLPHLGVEIEVDRLYRGVLPTPEAPAVASGEAVASVGVSRGG